MTKDGMVDEQHVVQRVRESARRGSSLLELITLIHDLTGTPPFRRMPTLRFLNLALGINIVEFQRWIGACQIFQPQPGSLTIEAAERAFREWQRRADHAGIRSAPGTGSDPGSDREEDR